MPGRKIKTQTTRTKDAKEQLSQLIGLVSRQEIRVVIEDNGAPAVAIISAQDLERLESYEAKREEDFAVIDQMREAFKDVPDEEIEREVARAIAEVRAENRQREKGNDSSS